MKLKNKVAPITCGAWGWGKTLALAMDQDGADIVVCDIDAKTLPATQAGIEAAWVR